MVQYMWMLDQLYDQDSWCFWTASVISMLMYNLGNKYCFAQFEIMVDRYLMED